MPWALIYPVTLRCRSEAEASKGDSPAAGCIRGRSSFEAPRALLRIARLAPQDDGLGSEV